MHLGKGDSRTENRKSKLEVGWRGCSRNYGMDTACHESKDIICVWKIHVFVYSPDRTENLSTDGKVLSCAAACTS